MSAVISTVDLTGVSIRSDRQVFTGVDVALRSHLLIRPMFNSAAVGDGAQRPNDEVALYSMELI